MNNQSKDKKKQSSSKSTTEESGYRRNRGLENLQSKPKKTTKAKSTEKVEEEVPVEKTYQDIPRKSESKDRKKQKKGYSGKDRSSDSLDGYSTSSGESKKNNIIIVIVVLLIFGALYFQYQMELQRRSFKGESGEEVDHYEVLGINDGASASEIRKAYKDLAKVWHPDKNPDCASCAEKFKKIAKAQEVLLGQVSGEDGKSNKSLFSSGPYFLTSQNYHKLVEESNDFWVICVYEGQQGSSYNKFIADTFDEVHTKYKSIIKFGVIDALRYPNLLHYLPYKFAFYPNIFTLKHGESELFENLDLYSVTTLTTFIDNSFTNKVTLSDDYYINNVITPYKNGKKEHMPYRTDFNFALDMKIFVVSGKNAVDLVTKDYAEFYQSQVSIYQNDFGFYTKVSYI